MERRESGMWFAASACLALVLVLGPGLGASPDQKGKAGLQLPRSDLSEKEQILHVLNRLAFGPCPGDVERIEKMGLSRYLEEQLHPEGRPDPLADDKLKELETLNLVSWELLSKYPDPAMLRQIQQRQNPAGRPAGVPPLPRNPEDTPRMNTAEQPRMAENPQIVVPPPRTGPAGPPPQNMAGITGPQRIVQELAAAKILRAVYSQWQLNEVLVDFWLNHFNVFIQKDAERWLMTEYERDVIRPHAWGKFKDLLIAVAKSPAMLMYLDNFQSVDPTPPLRLFEPRRPYDGKSLAMFPQPGPPRNRGLNENYARELLELHTLGVDGGYTQKDVVEVARCFTGWTMIPPQQGGGSVFLSANHDRGEKLVLGHRISAGGGVEDGLQVIDILVHHPSTARFIAKKLARHLLADDPPESVVTRSARTFANTDGDIREVVRSIITSPEFFSAKYYRAKFKRPVEFLVSALRALEAEVSATPALFGLLQTMGEPPYGCQPPTGYSDAASDWLSTQQLLRRMNVALALASGRAPGIKTRLDPLLEGLDPDDLEAVMDRFAVRFIGKSLSPEEKKPILDNIREDLASEGGNASAVGRAMVAALILGSPEFQMQ